MLTFEFALIIYSLLLVDTQVELKFHMKWRTKWRPVGNVIHFHVINQRYETVSNMHFDWWPFKLSKNDTEIAHAINHGEKLNELLRNRVWFQLSLNFCRNEFEIMLDQQLHRRKTGPRNRQLVFWIRTIFSQLYDCNYRAFIIFDELCIHFEQKNICEFRMFRIQLGGRVKVSESHSVESFISTLYLAT